jgi:Domain of unknown function (DUF4258)
MGDLFDKIIEAVQQERFVVSNHADDRLRERKIVVWQVISEIDHAIIVEERPHDTPFPSAIVEQFLPDGTPIRVVWSWDEPHQLARLVTVHLIDR